MNNTYLACRFRFIALYAYFLCTLYIYLFYFFLIWLLAVIKIIIISIIMKTYNLFFVHLCRTYFHVLVHIAHNVVNNDHMHAHNLRLYSYAYTIIMSRIHLTPPHILCITSIDLSYTFECCSYKRYVVSFP